MKISGRSFESLQWVSFRVISYDYSRSHPFYHVFQRFIQFILNTIFMYILCIFFLNFKFLCICQLSQVKGPREIVGGEFSDVHRAVQAGLRQM